MKYIAINFFATLSLLLFTLSLNAQFAGPVGSIGASAMYKDSSAFVNWASMCIVTRGYQDIANTSSGYATVGADTNGTKKASVNSVVSLGDGGKAILTFPQPIVNGMGFDFAVFENSFDDAFLELAFVEVSSDGINYVRFPATSNTQTVVQIGPFDIASDATKLNNLAGKYRAMYGTPFDLQELQGQAGLDVNNITHIKVVDVVGSINSLYATYDKNNRTINDPYPTAFGSGGFDLDAVGVINQSPVSNQEYSNLEKFIQVYPNPVNDVIFVYTHGLAITHLTLTDINGNIVLETTENKMLLANLANGFYILNITNSEGLLFTKKIVKN